MGTKLFEILLLKSCCCIQKINGMEKHGNKASQLSIADLQIQITAMPATVTTPFKVEVPCKPDSMGNFS